MLKNHGPGGCCCECPPVRFERIPDSANWHQHFYNNQPPPDREWGEFLLPNNFGLPTTSWTEGDDFLTINGPSVAVGHHQGPQASGWKASFDLTLENVVITDPGGITYTDSSGVSLMAQPTNIGILFGDTINFGSAYLILSAGQESGSVVTSGSLVIDSRPQAISYPASPAGEPLKIDVLAFSNLDFTKVLSVPTTGQEAEHIVQLFINGVEVVRTGINIRNTNNTQNEIKVGFVHGNQWLTPSDPLLPQPVYAEFHYGPGFGPGSGTAKIEKCEARPLLGEHTGANPAIPADCFVAFDRTFRGQDEPLQTPSIIGVTGVTGLTPAELVNVAGFADQLGSWGMRGPTATNYQFSTTCNGWTWLIEPRSTGLGADQFIDVRVSGGVLRATTNWGIARDPFVIGQANAGTLQITLETRILDPLEVMPLTISRVDCDRLTADWRDPLSGADDMTPCIPEYVNAIMTAIASFTIEW